MFPWAQILALAAFLRCLGEFYLDLLLKLNVPGVFSNSLSSENIFKAFNQMLNKGVSAEGREVCHSFIWRPC